MTRRRVLAPTGRAVGVALAVGLAVAGCAPAVDPPGEDRSSEASTSHADDGPGAGELPAADGVVRGTVPPADLERVADATAQAWSRCREHLSVEVAAPVVLVPESDTDAATDTDAETDTATSTGDAVATTVIIGRGATAQATVHLAPDAWRDLSEEGLRVILTHECVHVALVPATSSATPAIPLWLLEGVAEYVAYAASSVPTDEVLTPLWQQVAREGPPQDFPDDADFTAGHSDILLAYAKAHTAARSYVQRHSEEELVDLVLDTEADRAARVAELLPQWQADLREDAARVGAAQE